MLCFKVKTLKHVIWVFKISQYLVYILNPPRVPGQSCRCEAGKVEGGSGLPSLGTQQHPWLVWLLGSCFSVTLVSAVILPVDSLGPTFCVHIHVAPLSRTCYLLIINYNYSGLPYCGIWSWTVVSPWTNCSQSLGLSPHLTVGVGHDCRFNLRLVAR